MLCLYIILSSLCSNVPHILDSKFQKFQKNIALCVNLQNDVH